MQTEEIRLNWNSWIRQAHRWLALVFTLAVVANFVTMTFGQPPAWIVYSPLPPLFLMLFSGLYMFFLPYFVETRDRI
jgi:1,4-dihydroxy-2-naphthoate octaprenyltransferase